MTQSTNSTSVKTSSAVRTPELAVGLFIIAACVLGAMTWSRSAVADTSVLVVTTNVRRGQVLQSTDLGTIALTSSDDIELVPASSFDEAVGLRATVDIAPGTPLTPSQLTSADPLGVGRGLVGLVVEPGEAPADLAVGDSVRVLTTTRAADGSVSSAVDPTVFEVWDVEQVDPMDSSRVITLEVSVDEASTLLGREEIRLMKVNS
jgi:flagella basal body P-ring formation protein FlgA